MKYTGKIIVIAFPDTFVKGSTEFICKLLPYVGLGTKNYIKAGHAALLLVHNKTAAVHYYDFGRYVTPNGYGRVRSKETDAELAFPFKAKFSKNGDISNIEDILLWLDSNPQKTHGSGRLLASICNSIDYLSALTYLQALQERGSIPYGAFEKDGSNCSRLVADTLLVATDSKVIINKLKFNKLFTPSTVGNVEIASQNGVVYETFKGVVTHFKGSALKENLKNYFDKRNVPSLFNLVQQNIPEGFFQLEGTGSTSYFELVASNLPVYHFRIKRYNDLLDLDFDGVYVSKMFNPTSAFYFTFDSHCKYCHVIQNNEKIKLENIGTFKEINSLKKGHLA